MTLEDRLKQLLGEQAFQVVVLLHQLDEAQQRIKKLEAERVNGAPENRPD